ncbi:MAG: EAL domain-containing response regulator [Alphaproteobacteria bacterium]|nr:EAL domain-containing response regulator [Alphaproteobacteria bacterium]
MSDAREFLEHLRVLIVDDQPFVRSSIANTLGRLGVGDVVMTADGDQALEVLKDDAKSVDLVFCDLQMPGRDGIEVLRDLVELQPDAGVVLMSGEDVEVLHAADNLAKERGLRVFGSLEKPVSAADIKSMLVKVQDERTPNRAGPITDVTVDDLRNAIDNGNILPFFQPKVRLAEGSLESVEALARWIHPQHGIISPIVFIPMAEDNGLIDALTDAVMSQAFDQGKQWAEVNLAPQIAVNLSVLSLDRLELPDQILNAAATAGLEAPQVVLEITESRISEDPSALLDIITRFRLKRFELSIDDFGTGFSSLQQLQRLPFSELKIDQAFVMGASNNATAQSILESSISLAKKLNLRIVAEGVESREDWDLISRLGCDLAQGYLVAKPMPGNEIPAWHESWLKQGSQPV